MPAEAQEGTQGVCVPKGEADRGDNGAALVLGVRGHRGHKGTSRGRLPCARPARIRLLKGLILGCEPRDLPNLAQFCPTIAILT